MCFLPCTTLGTPVLASRMKTVTVAAVDVTAMEIMLMEVFMLFSYVLERFGTE